jgi:hypothetical protein
LAKLLEFLEMSRGIARESHSANHPARVIPIRILDNKPFDVFNNLNKSLTTNPAKLQLHIAGSALNFSMLPSSVKNARLIHHTFTMAPNPT